MNRTSNYVVSVGAGTTITLLAGVLLCGVRVLPASALANGSCNMLVRGSATIYVRSSGDDANDGASAAHALHTITCAAAVAKAGARIVVGPGTYNEGNITPTAFARVSFVADRRGTAVGEAAGDVVIDATTFPSGFTLNHNLAITIDGFVVYGAINGIYVKSQSDQAVVSNNIVSNTSNNGVYIQDSRGTVVFNNLVYNNAGTGILVATNTDGSPAVRVINNTVYKNGNRGIFFAGTTIGSPDGLVLNNITLDNMIAGIQVNAISRAGYVSAGNVFADRSASGTPIDVTDVRQDPLFVDPAGRDGILGGSGYVDDDFHVQQRAAGQSATSPAVDNGSDLARHLKLSRASTRSDGRPDSGYVDAGYHYDNFDSLPIRPQLSLRHAPMYVNATSGADINDGRSPSRPLQSLARALDLANPGDQILLQAGIYHEGELTLTNSGTTGRDIVIQGMPGARIDATGSARGILIAGRSYLTLLGLDISNASDSGVEIRTNSSNIMVRRCRLHHNGRRGLNVSDSTSVTAQADLVEVNGSRGIQTDNSQVDVIRSSLASNGEQGLWAINNSVVSVEGSAFVSNVKSGVQAEASSMTVASSTIRGGSEGGARFLQGSTGTLTGVSVSNTADAGIQGISSLVSVAGGTVEGNTRVGIEGIVDTASRGSNQLAVSGTRVCNNLGPGVHAQDSAITLTDVTLCSNAAEGLRQSNGTLQIARVTVTQNHGKGLSLTGVDQTTVQTAQITGNADAGVLLAGGGTISISGAVVSGNNGPGMWVQKSSGLTNVATSQFVNNAKQGVLAEQSAMSLTDTTVSGNTTDGVRQTNATLQLLRAVITQNQGKGLALTGLDHLTAQDVQISNNGDAGVLLSTSGASSMSGVVASSNKGHGVWAQLNTAPLLMTNGQFPSNTKSGVFVDHSTVSLTDGAITGSGDSGARFTNGSTGTLTRVSVTNNVNTGVQGLSSAVTLTSGTVENNSGIGIDSIVDTSNGGATQLTLDGTRVCSNQGQGIHAQDSTVMLSNAMLCLNAQEGLRQTGGSLQLVVATVTQNQGRGLAISGVDHFTSQGLQIDHNGDAGVWLNASGSSSMSGAVVSANQGQGLWAQLNTGPLVIANGQFTGNTKSGVLADHSAVSLTDGTVTGNGDSGARFINGSTGTLARVSMTNNVGNGVQGLSSAVTLTSGTVENNSGIGIDSIVDTASGGATQLTLDGTRVCSNQQQGIFAQGSTLMLSNATICSNSQEGLRQTGGSAQVVGSTVTQNSGRGISVDTLTQFALRMGTVTNNGDNAVQVLMTPSVTVSDSMVSMNSGNGLWATNGSTLTVSNSQFLNNTRIGVLAEQISSTLTDVTITGSGQDGFRQNGGAAQVTRTLIGQSKGKGISTTNTTQFTLQDSKVGGSSDNGVQVVTSGATSIGGSTIYSNQGDGIIVMDAPAPIVSNNLVYANTSTGILIAGDNVGSPSAKVSNNTIYGSGNRGVVIGGANDKPASAGAHVLRNIFEGNTSYGLQINQLSLTGYQGDYNLSPDQYPDSTPPGTHDIFSEAMFVDPTGAAPDFHLSQRPAGQHVTSPAVDAGGMDVATAELQGTSTRTDGIADVGIVDIGYHYHQ